MFSTFTITWVFCSLIVFYFHFYAGVLRTICFLTFTITLVFFFTIFTITLVFFLLSLLRFLLSLLRWVFCALFVFDFYYYVGVSRTICFLLLLLRWCVAYHLFSTFANTLVFCALFLFYFNYYVGDLHTNCFLLSLLL